MPTNWIHIDIAGTERTKIVLKTKTRWRWLDSSFYGKQHILSDANERQFIALVHTLQLMKEKMLAKNDNADDEGVIASDCLIGRSCVPFRMEQCRITVLSHILAQTKVNWDTILRVKMIRAFTLKAECQLACWLLNTSVHRLDMQINLRFAALMSVKCGCKIVTKCIFFILSLT